MGPVAPDAGDIDRIGLGHGRYIYNRPTSGAVYAPVSQRLLPLDESWRRKLAELPWLTKNLPEVMGTRGIEAVSGEWTLVSMAWNMKMMFALKG